MAEAKPIATGRARVVRDIQAAMAMISGEVEGTYDPRSGFCHYPANGGRLNVSEVLRRAGGVDKNTLKQPYHSSIKIEVERFVARMTEKLSAKRRNRRDKEEARDRELQRFAQIAYAHQWAADRASQVAGEQEVTILAQSRRIQELERSLEVTSNQSVVDLFRARRPEA